MAEIFFLTDIGYSLYKMREEFRQKKKELDKKIDKQIAIGDFGEVLYLYGQCEVYKEILKELNKLIRAISKRVCMN